MSDWKAKRFWKQAEAVETDGGFTVQLDGRAVKTPAKTTLVVPSLAMAQAIAAEWDAQEDAINPLTMPVTRGANAALDKVATQFDEVVDLLADYADSDLLCYRATGPDALVARQAEKWDPLLDWAANTIGARLFVGEGVMHVPQTRDALATFKSQLTALTPFQLTAAHDLISLSGSIVLALAVMRGHLDPDAAWLLSRVDEHWQIEQWGDDEDAAAQEEIKRRAFEDAARFFEMSLP
ncbi:ATP12 family chaperone protein [Yoonia sp. 208BN28-4]|uniref:ATP12 family chaperone protein n=1 Tax=Yoonia sp. 208BN28-4 TaxID=3126505 RepID=UPI0030953E49